MPTYLHNAAAGNVTLHLYKLLREDRVGEWSSSRLLLTVVWPEKIFCGRIGANCCILRPRKRVVEGLGNGEELFLNLSRLGGWKSAVSSSSRGEAKMISVFIKGLEDTTGAF